MKVFAFATMSSISSGFNFLELRVQRLLFYLIASEIVDFFNKFIVCLVEEYLKKEKMFDLVSFSVFLFMKILAI